MPVRWMRRPSFLPIENLPATGLFALGVYYSDSTARLETPISRFKSLQRIQELEADVSHLIRVRPELLHVLDGESDPIDSDACLVSQFKFHSRGVGLGLSLNQRK
jgi:hypothetical protein